MDSFLKRLPAPETHFRDGNNPYPAPYRNSPQTKTYPSGYESNRDSTRMADLVYGMLLHEYRRKQEVQAKADACWDAWLAGTYPNMKDNWQEEIRLPKVWMHTERSVAAFMDFITVVPEWFDIDSVMPQHEFLINILKEVALFDLDDDRLDIWGVIEDGFRELLLTGNTHVFVGAIADRVIVMEDTPLEEAEEDAFSAPIGGVNVDDFKSQGPLPTGPDKDDGETPKIITSKKDIRPHLELIPFERVYRDSSGKNRYIIWTTYMNVGDFRREAEIKGWDKEAVEKAVNSTSARGDWGTLGNQWRDIVYGEKGFGASNETLDYTIEITNFHGTLYHYETSEIVFEDQYAVVANGYLLTEPTDTPFWDGELPLVCGRIARNPKSAYGKSPIFESLGALQLETEMLLLMIDNLQRYLDPSFVVDKTVVHEDFRRKPMGPGQVFEAHLNGTPGPGIQPIVSANADGTVANIFQLVNTHLEGVTNALQEGGSAPRSRNRMSGVEFAAREQQASALIQHFFHAVDKEFLTPLVRLQTLRRLQFCSQSQWKTIVQSRKEKILYGVPQNMRAKREKELDEVSTWTAKERFRQLGGFLRFKVKILGNALKRQIKTEVFSSILNSIARNPNFERYLNMRYIMGEYLEAAGVNRDEALNPDPTIESPLDVQETLSDSPNIPPPNIFGSPGAQMGIGKKGPRIPGMSTPPPPPTEPPPPKR